MANRIKGITVTLYEKTLYQYDEFNNPIYTETPVNIENVLVAPISSNDIITNTEMQGKVVSYNLCIPKGDTHNWDNAKVMFFNEYWRTIGTPTQGIEEMIPLEWNKQIKVERYE